jgi:hypothetical protein
MTAVQRARLDSYLQTLDESATPISPQLKADRIRDKGQGMGISSAKIAEYLRHKGLPV